MREEEIVKMKFTKKEIEEIKKKIDNKTKKQLMEEIKEVKQEIKKIEDGISSSLDYFSFQEILDIRNRESKSSLLSGYDEIHQTFLKKYRPKGKFNNSKVGLFITNIMYLKILECNNIVFNKIMIQFRKEEGIGDLKSFLLNHRNKSFNYILEIKFKDEF